MNSSNCFEQKGVIKEFNKGSARVTFSSFSSCSNCESKVSCGMNESTTKHIDVVVKPGLFSIGEQVIVLMERSMGLKAVSFAYLIPFILLISSLTIFTSFHLKELKAGLLSMGILVVYFIILHLLRKKIEKTFSFKIKKIN